MKHLNRFIIVLVLLSIVIMPLAACAAKPAVQTTKQLEGNITVSGAFALYPMMTRWGEEFTKVYPNVKFDISAGGAGKGMADALAGAVDLGMVSRDITSDEEAKGAYWVAVVKDAVFPTVNAQNPVLQDLLKKGLTKQQFIDIFITSKVKTWGELVGRPEVTDEIHVYTRSDACGAADVWAKFVGNKKQEDLQGIAVFGDPGEVDAILKDPLGIGYNNMGYAFDLKNDKPVAGAAIVPIDVNENGQADPDESIDTMKKATEMVASGKYPSPPARNENLVTKGKPTGLTLAFIQWVLTDGQQYVGEAGYVKLPTDQLNASLQKVK
jgi:phosphate transport system substrate-binding protein